jgi:hypothetical protein
MVSRNECAATYFRSQCRFHCEHMQALWEPDGMSAYAHTDKSRIEILEVGGTNLFTCDNSYAFINCKDIRRGNDFL